MKNVIHIYGASGCGATTLGRVLCENLGYKLMDTDDYYWLPTNPPYQTKRGKEERVVLMKRDIETYDNVVVSGELGGWGDSLIPYFTIAVRLELDPTLRLSRIRKREQERFGERIEKNGDMYEHHLKFMKWASAFDDGDMNVRSKKKIDEWEKQLKCQRFLLNSENSVEKNAKIICDYLNNQS